jgi:uncharacterized protein YyaL (SSP411 family)
MIAALARGGAVLGEAAFTAAAVKAVDFIYSKLMRSDGRLLARYRDGEAAYPGYLDDYAFMIWGLLELYATTFAAEYLRQAPGKCMTELCRQAIRYSCSTSCAWRA